MNNKTTCFLCGNSNFSLITSEVRFGKKADVCKCLKCGLTLLDQNSFHFPKDFYEKEYHQTYITHVEPDAINPQIYYEKMKKITGVWADKFCKILTGNEKVLDVGCSTGHFMDLVKGKTKEIYGYDLNRNEIEYCRNVLKLDVSDQLLSRRFKEGTFDFITMIYVLEHIANPEDFLNFLKRFLKPDGKFVILVPNIQDALVNLYDIPVFRSFYYCIEHLFYYDPMTIKLLFDKVGLNGNIEVIQEYPLTNHLNWVYRQAPSDSLGARKEVPNISLMNTSVIEAWGELWENLNQMYQSFIRENGYGDRIWCIVGKNSI